MTRGKLEAKFSIVRKMSENHAKKQFKTKRTSSGIKHVKNISQGIRKLISDKKDYSKMEENF